MSRGEWFVDKDGICERLCISERFFDDHFKDDPRMKVAQVKRRKYWWETELARKAAQEIMYELDNG